MANEQNNSGTPLNPPVQPAPQPVPKPAAQNAPVGGTPQQTVSETPTTSAASVQTAGIQKAGAAAASLPKDQAKSNKKFVIGCLAAFGCSIFLFLGALFAFLAFGSSDNPIFGFLGAPKGEVIEVLFTLVNLIFLVLVFAAFIFVVIGVFKMTSARKDDKEAKRKGLFFTFGSLAVLVVLIFIWIFSYFFLNSKRVPAAAAQPIITEPVKTTNLTAPVTVKFDASKASIPKTYELLSYAWDFGDGAKSAGNPQTHTFTEVGNYKVKLEILLKNKTTQKEEIREFEKDVTIGNVTASVVIKADKKSGGAPLTVNLDGSGSSSPNGEITGYSWDLDEDGEFDDGSAESAQQTFDKIGTYKISLRVTDSKGEFAIGELEIEVTAPDTPIAVIGVEGVTGTELQTGVAYIFTATASTSPSGKIEKYSWDFGDGGKGANRTATYTYKTPGEYDVTLSVADSAKKKGETVQRFSVKAPDSPPLASIKTTPPAANGIIAGQAPFSVVFDASGSQDINNDIVEYAWDFDGDGKTDDTNAVTSYQFMKAGTFNAVLTLTDSANLTAKSQAVVQVEASGLRAQLTADPVAGVVPLTVKFDASGSSYPEGKIVNYEWDFGEGRPPRTDAATVSYQYTSIGTFTSKVTAITADGKRAVSELSVNVRPVPVKACFESTAESGTAPLAVEFDPTCSTGTVVKYRWNFANLGSSTDRKSGFTFKDAGTYNVSLEVTDSENVVDTFIQSITVSP